MGIATRSETHDAETEAAEQAAPAGGGIAAVAEVPHEHAGAASGIVTSAFQIGGAVGLALVSTAATTRVTDALASGAAQPDALAAGFQRGMLIVAGLAVANLVIGAIRAPRITPDAALVAEAAAA